MNELELIRSFRRNDATPNPVARAAARDRLLTHIAGCASPIAETRGQLPTTRPTEMTTSLAELEDMELAAAWNSGRDPARAVADCAAFLRAVGDGQVDPVPLMEAITHAFDVVLDGPDGAQHLVIAALQTFQTACREAEVSRPWTTDRRLRLRLTPAIWSAIVHHRLGYPREAMTRAYGALLELERFESEHAGPEALGSVTRNVVGELAVAITTILSATLRRVDLPAPTRQLLVSRCRRLYGAYALHGRDPVTYPRTPALAAQLMFLLAEERNPDDKPLIDTLKALDAQTRPTCSRGQVTRGLVEHAYASYRRDAEAMIAKTLHDADAELVPWSPAEGVAARGSSIANR